jgi:hypothetical protein
MHHQSRTVGQHMGSLQSQRRPLEEEDTYLERLVDHDVPGLGGHVRHRG